MLAAVTVIERLFTVTEVFSKTRRIVLDLCLSIALMKNMVPKTIERSFLFLFPFLLELLLLLQPQKLTLASFFVCVFI